MFFLPITMQKENFLACTGIAHPDEIAATWNGGIAHAKKQSFWVAKGYVSVGDESVCHVSSGLWSHSISPPKCLFWFCAPAPYRWTRVPRAELLLTQSCRYLGDFRKTTPAQTPQYTAIACTLPKCIWLHTLKSSKNIAAWWQFQESVTRSTQTLGIKAHTNMLQKSLQKFHGVFSKAGLQNSTQHY